MPPSDTVEDRDGALLAVRCRVGVLTRPRILPRTSLGQGAPAEDSRQPLAKLDVLGGRSSDVLAHNTPGPSRKDTKTPRQPDRTNNQVEECGVALAAFGGEDLVEAEDGPQGKHSGTDDLYSVGDAGNQVETL